MSQKVATFLSSCPAPKTQDRFLVHIPGVINSHLRVSSTTFPQQSRSVMTVNVSGQPVYIPGKSQVPGVWTCVLDESINNDANYQIQLLKRLVVSFATETIGYALISPIIFITDQETGQNPQYWGTLMGAWLESVEQVPLSWAAPHTPIQWKLTFRYTSIVRLPLDDELPI